MVVILDSTATREQIAAVRREIEQTGCSACPAQESRRTILGVIGDTRKIDPEQLRRQECVEGVLTVTEPYKKANRLFHPENTVVQVADRFIGGDKLTVMAGPCSVES